MHELYSFRSAIQATNVIRQKAAFQIERLAFAAMLMLAVSFPMEALNYPITIAGQTYSNIEVLQFVVLGLWTLYRSLSLGKHEHTRKLPPGLVLSTGLWAAVLWLSAFLAPQFRELAIAFDVRLTRGVLLAAAAFDLTN